MKAGAIYHVLEWFYLCGGTGNVSCDIWPHHCELLAPSERTEDLSLLVSQHPLMSHQAGLVSLLQAGCDQQHVQGTKIKKQNFYYGLCHFKLN